MYHAILQQGETNRRFCLLPFIHSKIKGPPECQVCSLSKKMMIQYGINCGHIDKAKRE